MCEYGIRNSMVRDNLIPLSFLLYLLVSSFNELKKSFGTLMKSGPIPSHLRQSQFVTSRKGKLNLTE